MGTRVVRLAEEDVERVNRLCGMTDEVPFSEKVRAVLRLLDTYGSDLAGVRTVVREELERLTWGP